MAAHLPPPDVGDDSCNPRQTQQRGAGGRRLAEGDYLHSPVSPSERPPFSELARFSRLSAEIGEGRVDRAESVWLSTQLQQLQHLSSGRSPRRSFAPRHSPGPSPRAQGHAEAAHLAHRPRRGKMAWSTPPPLPKNAATWTSPCRTLSHE